MKPFQKHHWLTGVLLMLAGVVAESLAKLFAESSHKVTVAAEILAIALIAWSGLVRSATSVR